MLLEPSIINSMRIYQRIIKFLKPSPPRFQPPPKEVIDSISEQIRSILQFSYDNPYLHRLYKSVPVKFLLDESVKMYVGSVTCPKNLKVVERLLAEARSIGNQLEQKSIDYYQAVFGKLSAMTQGHTQGFDNASERLLQLAGSGHAIANYLIGKEMWAVAKELGTGDQRAQMMVNAMRFFELSVNSGCFQSFYLMGTMFETGQVVQVDRNTAFEYFVVAASFDNPYAFYKLSQYYKNGDVVEADNKLYIMYLKKAAEMGLTQAQHNLAIEYMNGQHVKMSQVRAFGWFIHASGAGFVPSKYNTAILLLRGTDCGTLKPNPRSALFTLQDIQGKEGVDVNDLIQKVEKTLQQEEARQRSEQ